MKDMNHRLLPWTETYASKEDINKYFIKYFGTNTPDFKLLTDCIFQILNPHTHEVFENYLCFVHKGTSLSSLRSKTCILMITEDLYSGKSIIYAISPTDYRVDIKELAFRNAIYLIDKLL